MSRLRRISFALSETSVVGVLADGAYGALVPVSDSEALAAAMSAALLAPPPMVPPSWFEGFSEHQAVRRYLEVSGFEKPASPSASPRRVTAV